jgi:hypothetical protein
MKSRNERRVTRDERREKKREARNEKRNERRIGGIKKDERSISPSLVFCL